MADDSEGPPKIVITGTPKIVVNGQEIGPEAVPEFLRKFVQDANKNGIPDMMEHLLSNPMVKMAMSRAGSELQNLSPEQRAKIEQLMTRLGGMVQGTAETPPSVTTVPAADPPAPFASSFSSSSSSVSFNPSSNAPVIDYKKLGIEDPDKKSSLPSLLIAALLGGLAVLVALWFLKGHL